MAVYTKVSEEDAAEFLAHYDLGELRELEGIKQGVENSNFYLTTTAGRFVLTLYEKRVQEEDLPFFLGLTEHLAKKGLPASLPVRDKSGVFLGHLCGRPAAITGYLPGRAPVRITPEECAETGRMLARMHLAAGDFKMHRANNLGLSGWEKLVSFTKNQADEISYGLAKILQDELDSLSQQWPENLPQGIIHADLFPDNVFFGEDGKLCGLIDFYFACDDILAYDLAVCLNSWCFESSAAFNITKARAMIKAYNEVRLLSPEEIVALPLLARGSALRFLLTRLYDWLHQSPDALVKPKNPLDYLARLQFHQSVKDISAYGLDA